MWFTCALLNSSAPLRKDYMTETGGCAILRITYFACRGPVYAAVGTQQETVFPLDGAHDASQLHRKAWATSYDSLPSSAALDDGLDPQPNHHLDRCRADIPPLALLPWSLQRSPMLVLVLHMTEEHLGLSLSLGPPSTLP